MKKLINFSTDISDTERYSDNADLKTFYRRLGFDGLELMRVGDDKNGIVRPDDIVGVHLRFFSVWMDLWTGDKQRLLREFDNYETVAEIYGGTTREALTGAFIGSLNDHPRAAPEYFVFHVSECQLVESIVRQYHYTSAEIADAAADLVNSFSDAIPRPAILLFENLWYPGMNMLEPEVTFRLLEKVKYPDTGVMLDIGHLLHTNMSLRAPGEAVDYVHKVLDMYGDLSFIKGIHLHQTLNGEYSENLTRTWTPPQGSYKERSYATLQHIFKIDAHQPFSSARVNELIERIQPQYLVLEQISYNRREHTRNLKEQLRYLK